MAPSKKLQPDRNRTDKSLSDERLATDGLLDGKPSNTAQKADRQTRENRKEAAEKLRRTRARTDRTQTKQRAGALDIADRLQAERTQTDEILHQERERTDRILRAEHRQADALAHWEREETNRLGSAALERDRGVTDEDLARERASTDRLVGDSMVRLRSLAEHRLSVQEEESKRIARAVHDELGQALTALKIDLSGMKKHGFSSERLERMEGLVEEMIERVRSIASELRPRLLDDFGLAAAIEWQARQFEARTGIRCELRIVPEDFEVARPLSTAVFRVFQEILTNVVRHAQARRVRVSLTLDPARLQLEVHDDGRGIRPEEISDHRSLGILSMGERMLACGGQVRIEGAPGAGTTVLVQVPMDPASGSKNPAEC